MKRLALASILALAACAAPAPAHRVTYHAGAKEVFTVEIQPVGNSSIITGAAGILDGLLGPLLVLFGL